MVPVPASMTETSFEDSQTEFECKMCEENLRKKSCATHFGMTLDASAKRDSYDRMLPKSDPRLMSNVRRWEKNMGFVTPLRWRNIVSIFLFHLVTTVWFVTYIYRGWIPKWETILFSAITGGIAGFGVTAGAHRYWCHRSYKANRPLQVILLLCYSVAGQNTIYEWVRDHRVHHKFSETSADPHNVHRGFFFSHVGWLMMKKHPRVLEEGSKLDLSDILNDPLIVFHTKYFMAFKVMFCFILPTVVPVLWGETWDNAVLSQAFLRYMFSLNCTWSVNSFAHLWGNKPYDRYIMPVENWGVSLLAMGEGWHNYHHSFPWDYKAAELAYTLNITTFILDLFAKIGWAYDMKTASPSLVRSIALRKGELKNK